MTEIISVRNFSMHFGKTKVIENLSFEVHKGEVFGLLGSNGCGKTTTIRTLLGIYSATAGECLINGKKYDPQNCNLGYLPEERGLYKKEKVIDIMTYFGRLKGMTANAAKAWSLQYLERVQLQDKAKTRLDKLSGGQQQKVQLGVTVMNDPELLILDEPTKGFDPVNRRLLMEIIDELHGKGATILMVTHQMDEVERVCDRILLLKDGNAAAYGAITEVQRQFGGDRIRLRYNGQLPQNEGYQIVLQQGNYAELVPAANVHPNQILQFLAPQIEIISFDLTPMSIDEIFVQVYGERSVA